MTIDELRTQTQMRDEMASALAIMWKSYFPDVHIDREQLLVWLDRHSLDTIVEAIRVTAHKDRRLEGQMSEEHIVRFCSKVCNITTLGPKPTMRLSDAN